MPPLAFGPFLLDATERRLLRDDQPVVLTPKAFDLLCLLVERNGHLVLKEDLLHALWPNTFVEEANLNRCVSVRFGPSVCKAASMAAGTSRGTMSTFVPGAIS